MCCPGVSRYTVVLVINLENIYFLNRNVLFQIQPATKSYPTHNHLTPFWVRTWIFCCVVCVVGATISEKLLQSGFWSNGRYWGQRAWENSTFWMSEHRQGKFHQTKIHWRGQHRLKILMCDVTRTFLAEGEAGAV